MITLPTGMQAKIDSAQQTLYNGAQPEMRIRAHLPLRPPDIIPVEDLDLCWGSLASDSDGTNLIGCASETPEAVGRLFTSTDGGAVWEERRPAGDNDRRWHVASDATGANLVAAAYQHRLYTSDDGGENWTERRPDGDADNFWWSVASSDDGLNLVAAFGGAEVGGIYTSDDGGATWDTCSPPTNLQWIACASDSDGAVLIAVNSAGIFSTGLLYVSTNGGVSWTERQPAGNLFQDYPDDLGNGWMSVAANRDGSVLMAGGHQEARLRTSFDSGVNWTERRPAGNIDKSWRGVACDDSGDNLIAVSDRVWTSANGGVSWTERRPAGDVTKYWSGAVSDADGTNLAVYDYYGTLYTSADSGATWTLRPCNVEVRPAEELHYNAYWAEHASATLGTGKSWTDIVAVATNRIWICNDVGQIYYYNGTSWSLSHDLVDNWHLESIHAFSERDVWAVGWRNDPTDQYIILHLTSTGWAVSVAEAGPKLTCIWGGDPRDVWAIGLYGLQLRWNGSAWTTFRAADLGLHEHEHVRLAGYGSDFIVAVGYGGRVFIFDGDTWSTTGYLFSDAGADLENVSVVGPWRIIATGNNAGTPVVIQSTSYGFTNWATVGVSTVVDSPLNGIWAWRDCDAFLLAAGDAVLDTSKRTVPLDVQDVEGTSPEPRQFWRFPGTNIWCIGYCSDGTGVWKLHPQDEDIRDISAYLSAGEISLSSDPISSLTLELENPDGDLMDEVDSLIGMGAKFELDFRIGNTEWFPMGTYILDRGTLKTGQGTISIDARNSIGKYLADLPVPVDELYHRCPYKPSDWISAILDGCGITDYEVYDDISDIQFLDEKGIGFAFPRETMALDAIRQLILTRPEWRILERYDGTVIVGPPPGAYESDLFPDMFPVTGDYEFSRDTDAFSREVVTDDREVYSQVAVISAATSITAEGVGEGDGVSTVFPLLNSPVVVGSEIIYVDDMPKVRDVDYYIDYTSGIIAFETPPPDEHWEHNKLRVVKYKIEVPNTGEGCPIQWELQGSNDNFVSDKHILDSRVVSAWTGEQVFDVSFTGDYRWHSIQIYKSALAAPNIIEVTFINDVDEEIQGTLTAPGEPVPYIAEASAEYYDPVTLEWHYAWNAFDGDTATSWIPGTAVAWWLKLDFGATLASGAAQITADYEASNYVYVGVPLENDFAIPANKTWFISVAEGTSPRDALAIANEVASQVGTAGELETFVGPIRPQLIPYDRAVITPDTIVGITTTVLQGFGKKGFSTTFTVDSGGRIGAPTVKELVDKLVARANVTMTSRNYSGS